MIEMKKNHLVDFTRMCGFFWRVSDCEELVWEFKEASGLLTIIGIFGFIQTPQIRIFRDRSIVQYRPLRSTQ